MNKIKSFLDALAEFFESFGRARAAAELARCGHYQAATRLINGDYITPD